jgi:non-specific serine/threonine protein kinase
MVEGPWTDIYSVAAVLHFAMTGKRLPAPAARMASDTLLRDAQIEGYSTSFLDAVDRGLAVIPEHRPQTIAEFRATLGIHQIASDAPRVVRREPSRAASTAAKGAIRPLPEVGSIPRVGVPEPERVYIPRAVSPVTLPPPEPEQPSPTAAPRTTITSSSREWPWKLVLQLLVVGLVALGLLVWTVDEPRRAPPEVVDRALSMPPVPSGAQPSPPVAASTIPTESAPPVAANPAVAEPALHDAASPDVGGVTSVPRIQTTPAPSATPAPRTGRIRFSIQPWGEIIVDGKTRGASPPMKELSLPEGRQRIEVRNGSFPGYVGEVDIRAGSTGSNSHSFKAP